MADSIWTGGSGDLTAAGNWAGGVPGDGDRAFFRAGYATGPSTNMAGLSDTLALIHVGRGCTFDIGGSGTELKVSATDIVHRGLGKLWYDGDADSGQILIDCDPGGSADIQGPIDGARILRGTVTVGAMSGLVFIAVGYRGSPSTDEIVTLGSSAGTTTNYYQWGGTVASSNILTNAYVMGGTLQKVRGVSAAITNLYESGGLVQYWTAATMTLGTIFGGTLDTIGAGQPQTITALWLYPGSEIDRDTDLLTVTTENDVRAESA